MKEQQAKAERLSPQKRELQRLQREVEILTTGGIIEVAVRNPRIKEYAEYWQGRCPDWKSYSLKDCRDALQHIAGAFRRMNMWKEAIRTQKVADSLYPKGEIKPQPIIPRSHWG